MKAFFPISLSISNLKGDAMKRALLNVIGISEEVIVMVADRLQTYNYAAMHSDFKSLDSIIDWRNYPRGHYEERKKWVLRAIAELPERKRNIVSVIRYDDAVSGDSLKVFRNLKILYHISLNFRKDVDETVETFAATRNFSMPAHTVKLLSVEYVLEEIAVNIDFRTRNNLTSEFYVGTNIKPLHKVYKNLYEFSVGALVERSFDEDDYKFYRINIDAKDELKWERI